MKNKKMFIVKPFNIYAYSMCLILLFGCTPNQKKLEELASQKEYDKLYSYVERVNNVIDIPNVQNLREFFDNPGFRNWRYFYDNHQKRYEFALTTLVGTKDTTILKNVEKMFYELHVESLQQSVLQAFQNHKAVFEDLEKFCAEYNDVISHSNTALYDLMLERINDWRSVKYIYASGPINRQDFLNSFPMLFFKHPEVQKLKHEIELDILETETISPLEDEILKLEKKYSNYSYRELSGYVIKQIEPGFYEVQLENYSKRIILRTSGTHFSSAGYFSGIKAEYVKKILINQVNSFNDAWELWAEVSGFALSIYRDYQNELKEKRNELHILQKQKKNIEKRLHSINNPIKKNNLRVESSKIKQKKHKVEFTLKNKDPDMENGGNQEEIVKPKEFTDDELIDIMNNYYDYIKIEDFDMINTFYSNFIDRFYLLRSINNTVAIEEHKKYLSSNRVEFAEIIPASIIIDRNNNEYLLQYKLDYKIRGKNDNILLLCILDITVSLDLKGKIISIHETINYD